MRIRTTPGYKHGELKPPRNTHTATPEDWQRCGYAIYWCGIDKVTVRGEPRPEKAGTWIPQRRREVKGRPHPQAKHWLLREQATNFNTTSIDG